MRKNVVVTLTGHDRVGIVDEVTEILLKHDGNVESSKMARLGGEFAMLALITIPEGKLANLENDLMHMAEKGFKLTFVPTKARDEISGRVSYQIEINGADHEGIIHEIAHHLRQFHINIETAETETSIAPMSGSPLFNMKAVILVPDQILEDEWTNVLEESAHRLGVDIQITLIK
jgi:glycine cleavage system transcriptional repressor